MDWIEEIERGRTVHLEAGETAFRQGNPVYAVFRVKSGRVRLTRTLENGATLALHTARAGDTFAEAAVSADAYHCDAVADVRSELVAFPIQHLRERLSSDPQTALSFAMFMASQVRTLRARLELRNIRSAKERLLAWLELNGAGVPLSVPTDQPWTEVAADIGLTREALYRALADLSRAGAIRRENGRTILLREQ
ncbi:Crp/Fnr family transcriptional regulator [Skermanella stibiiresistens]|uniref:Crp/Fnr family transcriptional regulator n=1 Tax=Skermanella stibiiresistens TaxID=913326 RepID=UPI0007C738F4|nr:Crp/Fnr family transcriptional regulator [Skermanella stibiiresistens]